MTASATGPSGGCTALLRRGGEIVGVIGIEDRVSRRATPEDHRHLVDLARAAAMAVDNAHWLAEIHERGAERERSRLARELHDHVGQSVVYLGFELDRLAEVNQGRTVRHDLLTLREDMRELAGDLRGTLVSLRCDVSPDQGIEDLLPGFLTRIESRTSVSTQMSAAARCPARALGRTPILERRQGSDHQCRTPRRCVGRLGRVEIGYHGIGARDL